MGSSCNEDLVFFCLRNGKEPQYWQRSLVTANVFCQSLGLSLYQGSYPASNLIASHLFKMSKSRSRRSIFWHPAIEFLPSRRHFYCRPASRIPPNRTSRQSRFQSLCFIWSMSLTSMIEVPGSCYKFNNLLQTWLLHFLPSNSCETIRSHADVVKHKHFSYLTECLEEATFHADGSHDLTCRIYFHIVRKNNLLNYLVLTLAQ